MPPMSSILIYGRDKLLLQTRSWVLEQAGYQVHTTIEEADAARQLRSQPVGVFILCHTLTPDQCTDLLANAHAHRPEVKTLVLAPRASIARQMSATWC